MGWRPCWALVARRSTEAELGKIPTSLTGGCSELDPDRRRSAVGASCLRFCSQDEVWCAAYSMPARKASDEGHVVSTRAGPNDTESRRDLLDFHGALSSVHDQVEGCVVIEIRGLVVQIQKDHRR